MHKRRTRKAARRAAMPARYLLACADGHLDEFPYDLWVHRWKPCAHAEFPEFARLGATLRRLRDLIGNTLDTGTTNARAEATHCPDDDHNDR